MTDNKDIITVQIDQLIIGAHGFFARPLDQATVQRYRAIIAKLPAVEGWIDPASGEIHLLDGRHRVEAHRQEGITSIHLESFQGSRQDAEVRSRVANMSHPFQLTGTLWRQAATEVVRLRHPRSNNWIAEEANCSPLTVKNIRLELEQAGEIPYLDRLERKGGGMVLREFNRDKDMGDPGQEDGTGQDVTAGTSSLSLGGEDFLDQEEEERTGENQRDRWDSDSTAARQPESTPERERSKSQHPEDRSDDATPGSLNRSNGSKGVKQKQQTLKFVPGEADALPAEVIIYVNGSPQSIPVTIMFAQGAIAGIPESSLEDYQRAALVVDVEIGKQRGLVF